MRKIFFLLIIQIIAFAAYTQTQCGSTNIAQGKTVTASTDPYSLKTSIVDGNVSTNWYVGTTADQWLYVDLGQQYVVCKAIVKWTLWSYLTSFKIQYSNTANNDWVDLANINGNPVMSGDNQYQYHDVPISNAPAARYIRLLLPAMGAFSTKVAEFEIYNSIGGGGGGGTNGPEWYTTGNDGITSSNFLGTTNNAPLIVKTNSVERLSIHGNADDANLKLSGGLNGNLSLDFSANGTVFHRITSNANAGYLDIVAGATGGGHNIRFFTDNVERGRIDNYGKWQVGATTGSIVLDPLLSRPNDRIRIGGYINTTDGQNILISTSSDGGATYKNMMVERDGFLGLGTSDANAGWMVGKPALRLLPDGRISIASTRLFFGSEGGPFNSSSLLTYVSNQNEWTSDVGYPNGQNYYYFGTILQAPQTSAMKRAPLIIGGREVRFAVGPQGDVGTPGTEAAKFSEDANFLIGATVNNGNKLQVNGNIWTTGFILPTGAGAGKVLTSDASGIASWQTSTGGGGGTGGWALNGNPNTNPGTQFIGTTDATDFVVRTGDFLTGASVERMRVGANGKVGIGATNLSDPKFNSYRLIVDQGIKTKRVNVDVSVWPDYVFHKSYQLPSLEFVEQYIKEHQHLPDVPSEKEVLRDGLDLGDNQTVLLKKIEELTLYLIEQNKKIIEQQKQIEEQQKKINNLEKKILKH